MHLKVHIKYYLFFGLLYFFGASSAAGLHLAYRLPLPALLSVPKALTLSFTDYALFISAVLEPLTLTFLTAFTLYACPVGVFLCLCAGISFGDLAMRYGLSKLSPFTHAAALLFLIAFGVIVTLLATHTALCRSALKSVAPEPKTLLREKTTLTTFQTYLCLSALAIVSATALYFFLVYFPIGL